MSEDQSKSESPNPHEFESNNRRPQQMDYSPYGSDVSLAEGISDSRGHYTVDFRVVIGGQYKVPENGRLMVYLLSQDQSFPLEYSSKIDAYHFELNLPVEKRLLTYKFFVLLESTSEQTWEKVPFNYDVPVWNRKCFAYPELYGGVRAVMFDAVFFEDKPREEYQKEFRNCMLKLIPRLDMAGQSGVDSRTVGDLISLHDQWAKAYLTAKRYVNEHNYSVEEFGCSENLETLSRHLADSESERFKATHVCENVCLFLAIRSKITFWNRFVKSSVCLAMSLDGLDDDQFALFLKFFDMLKTSKLFRSVTRSNFEYAFKNALRHFEEVPEFIFVIPMVNLVESSDACQNAEPPDSCWQRFRDKMRNSELDQKFLMERKDRIMQMSNKFPWVSKLFAQSLNLKSVAELLDSDSSGCLNSNFLLAKLAYFWRQLKQRNSRENLTEEVFAALYTRLFEDLKQKIRDFDPEKGLSEDEKNFITSFFTTCLKIPREMKEYLQKSSSTFEISYFAYTFNLCDGIIEYSHVALKKDEAKSILSKVAKLKEEMLSVAKALLRDGFLYTDQSLKISLWNCLSEIDWSDHEFKEKWLAAIRDAMMGVIRRVFTEDRKLIEFYCERLEKMNPNKVVMEWFTEVVSSVFVDFVHSWAFRDLVKKGWEELKRNIPGNLFQSKVVTLCEKLLKNQFKNFCKYQKEDRLRFLLFVQDWNTVFLQTIYEYKLLGKLPSDLKNMIGAVEESTFNALTDLQAGSITIECLTKLSDIKTNFFDCLFTFQNKKSSVDHPFTNASFHELLNLRIEEMNEVLTVRAALHSMLNFFQSVTKGKLELKCEEMQDVFKQSIVLDSLDVLVECRQFKPGVFPSATIRLLCFNIPPDDLALVKELHSKKATPLQSTIVKTQMSSLVRAAQEDGFEEINFSEALESLWKPLQERITETVQNIDDGTMVLRDVDDLFGKILKNDSFNKNVLNNELSSLYGVAVGFPVQEGQRANHFRLLKNYYTLKQNLFSAKLLRKMEKILGLDGEFDDLDRILDVGGDTEDLPLSAMSGDVQKTNDALQVIGEHELHVQTLKVFVQAKGLVRWLKDNVKDTKEVKVMVDLAMISAGEVPMEVDKVSCFNSAVMGFSPLIFNLYPDSGLSDLLEACQEVWENVKADPSILAKWEEASNQLSWLDYVKSFHGSVEKSSLEKAETINSKGVYVIQCAKDDIPTVENSMKLIVKEDVEMSLNDLRDLQSRLMLIAGESAKGEVDVTRFMKVLSSVENLAKTYVKLKTSGCPLFNDWSANIRCENEGQGNVTVEVFFDEKCQAISSSEKIIDELVNLTDIFDEAHRQWMSYLAENRNKHYHLNHFNIQQLTYLCRELASTVAADYNEQVYQLLASVLPDADEEALFECLEEATRVDEIERLRNIPVAEDEETLSEIEKKKNMVRKLVRLELSEKMAKAAVQEVGYDDADDCLIWALSNTDDVEELVQQFDNEIGFESSQYNTRVIHNIVNDRSDLTLKEVISRLQSDTYSQKATMSTIVKTICKRYFARTAVTSLEDHLSLEHCGKFLTCLASRRNQRSVPQRDWSGHFVEGKPNLLICRQPKDVLLMLLSIYMHSFDQSFPSASEVLLCSEETSAEEVELLFRRAAGLHTDTGERIYCLANADLLPFHVSKKAEECFENLMQNNERNERFRLVILTCNEQHYLTSCFYEQRVEGFGCLPDASKYLKRHLCRKRAAYSAARIDENCSSAIAVCSGRSGMGKSLYISRCHDRLFSAGVPNFSTIRLLEKSVDIDDVVMTLSKRNRNNEAHFVHIDITPSVQTGKSKLLFDLLILGRIQNSRGVVWRHQPTHLYMLEYTDAEEKIDIAFSKFFAVLPSIKCLSPVEVRGNLQQKNNEPKSKDQVFMDSILLESEMYQRPFQYLRGYQRNENLDGFAYMAPIENSLECLTILLEYCSVEDPSWSELSHFSKFLNVQLEDCEESDFCNPEVMGDEFQGFKHFIVHFMIRMAQDFATPSLQSDDDNGSDIDDNDVNLLELHRLRRKWESSFHPYVFFNADRHSMSFANFNVNTQGTLCHPKTKQEVEQNLIIPDLVQALTRNYVDLQQDIDKMTREQKLTVLCQVFGVEDIVDPDKTYELTSDNVVKMLAIQMRFRCGIPVVMMGETGCGKTRMIDFMSKLKAAGNPEVQNMVVVKVHGGVTASMVQEEVEQAVIIARRNKAINISETILFLDEANTTEAVYAIKEIMCDETVRGKSFADTGLRIVAACNPYRAHRPEIIEAMEKSGLGFHVRPEDVSDMFDDIPMRHLVYRVIALPPSMRPLVWDFGQLSNDTEEIYINQMVMKLVAELMEQDTDGDTPIDDRSVNTITKVVTASQAYMREQRDVCKFVSLRDAERVMQTFKWFYQRLDFLNRFIEEEKEKSLCLDWNINNCIRALIQAVSVCYNATLDERENYRVIVAREICRCEDIDITEQMILEEIVACQNVFINAIDLENNIACNEALRENVFMMVICAEMKIPLFLVGKPGSSKSLAKTIVTDAMQGRRSKHELYQRLKEIHVLSFQCSAATDAVGIQAVFSQCAQLQEKKDIQKYVAMVVLDEIGLAEDSKKMPLKVLHPLLETASTTSTSNVENHQRVGFVGISNWALDPAKMNRGIFVTRGKPTNEDLHKTAEAIFESDQEKLQNAKECIKAVTDAYLELYQVQAKEFFGLRDYYAMMKMLFASSGPDTTTFSEVGTAVIRNFSGASDEVLAYFQKHCREVFSSVQMPHIPVTRLIRKNLDTNTECRFLMILTKQYSAVNLLPEILGSRDYAVIFGSSFPHDHDYTEVCRNINKIKVCMETGRTVVLLNLRDLYESLYDALNQHYVTFAGQRYVDLGLGGHRVKCRIASNFKLIVIEEKEVVYHEYPIPLINRLEKHIFEMGSVLATDDKTTINHLKDWVENSCKEFTAQNTFLGYNDDSCASALLSSQSRSLEATQKILLQTATLDGVCRFSKAGHSENLLEVYMHEQIHDSLWMFLEHELEQHKISVNEVVTFSQVLNERDRQTVQNKLQILPRHCMLLILQQFQTEQQFSERIDHFLDYITKESTNPAPEHDQRYLLLIQCSQAHKNASLTACAKYSTMNKIQQFKESNFDFEGSFTVCFLFTMERSGSTINSSWSYVNFYCRDCSTVYLDELKPNSKPIAPVSKLWSMSIHEVIGHSVASEEGPVNINQLMHESIAIAMAKLQNRVVDLKKNRIQLLLSLCFENHLLAPTFYEMLLKKILRLIEDRETKMVGRDDWIVAQACSARALQEGGTFKNVLWLCVKNIVAIALAKIVSIADADDNLDLLQKSVQDCREIAELWFQMFSRDDLWELQWTNASMNSLETSFVVEGYVGFSCSFPFSRSIYNVLKKEHQKLQEVLLSDQRVAFFDRIERSSISWVFDAAEESGMTTLQRFACDLVHLMYKPRSAEVVCEEYGTVLKYVLQLHKLQRQSKKRDIGNALVEVFLLLLENTKYMQTFAEMVEIHPDVLFHCNSWIDETETDAFCLHQIAFECVVKHLDEIAKESFGKVLSCNQWKSLAVKTKQISDKMLHDADESVQKMWQRIVFVEMFLDELLPSAVSENTVIRYLKPLSLQARLLWSGAVAIKDLSLLRFLKIVVNSLKKCTKEIELRLLCNWKDISCKACKREALLNPVELDCGHHFCRRCITGNRCPVCRKDIDEPELLEPMQLTGDQQQEVNAFKSAGTSFFLEYLSTICFPCGQNNFQNFTEEMFLALEELVINDNKTKIISPVLAEIDLNPTARSYILQLLLRYDEKLVEQQLESHFRKMERVLNDRTALMEMYINCKQDILLHQSSAVVDEHDMESSSVIFAYRVLREASEELQSADMFSQLEHLRTCAMLQFVAKIAVFCIMQTSEEHLSEEALFKITTFINALYRFCAAPEFLIFRQFIIKCLCRRYGTDALNIMLENDLFRKLVPENLLPQADEEKDSYFRADKLSLTGERYRRTKTLLLDIAQESDEDTVLQQIVEGGVAGNEVIEILLAASTWVAYDRNPARMRTFQHLCQQLPQDTFFQVFAEVAQGQFEALRWRNANANSQYSLTELLVHFVATISNSQDNLLRLFRELAANPDYFINFYFPTMPATNYAAIRNALGVTGMPKSHLCPNGHPYYIGECGRPLVQGRCPECGAPIGGTSHRLAQGNHPGEAAEENQTGYKPRKTTSVVPERQLSKLSVCATRICLHLAMLLGSRNGDAVARMVQRNQEADFLFEEIQFDLKEITKLIGRGVDDAFMLMHLIFNQMRTTQSPAQQRHSWNSLNERETWENEFQRCFLTPICSNAANNLDQAQDIMINAGKLTEKPLERLVFELKKDEILPDGIVPWNTPNLWKYMMHVDINHLRQTLESVDGNSTADGAALKLIVNSENLEVIQHLYTIITVQSAFIKKYRQRIDMSNAGEITIQDFLDEENYEDEIEIYIQVWNKVRLLQLNADRYNIPPAYLEEDMSRDSPISMCLPSRRGMGLCAFILADYLMEKQNDLLLACRELVEPKPSLKAVDVGDLEGNDLICIDSMEDLMPIVLENSQYETIITDNGLKHNISYNLGLLQKKILQKFFYRKRIINKETLPMMKYPQDMGLANDFQAVQNESKQIPLPLKLCQEVDDLIENCLTAKLCEVVRTLTLVVQFLAKDASISGEQRIFEFAEKELLLPPEETEMIPRSALISHCLALYERLSWHRSKRLIQNGQNPFENVVENSEDIQDEGVFDELKATLTTRIRPHIDRLQLELNALLMVGPHMEPDWRLGEDVLLQYLELKDEETDASWCEQIPPEILFKHAVHVFNISMEYAAK